MKHLSYSLLLLTVISISSCQKVKVVVARADLDTDLKHKTLTIDTDDPIKLRDTTFNIYLSSGDHNIKLDNDASQSITIGDKGGMINVDNREYVAFEVLYAVKGFDDDEQNMVNPLIKAEKMFRSTSNQAAIVVDSIVILKKHSYLDVNDATLRGRLPDLMAAKNGNLVFSYGSQGMTENESYDRSDVIYGLKKFGKDQLYINKFWNYDINEKIPEQISGTKQTVYNVSQMKTATMSAKRFLITAAMNPQLYTIKPVSAISKEAE